MSDTAELEQMFDEREREVKEERFESSVVKGVLTQLGATPTQLRLWESTTSFDCNWFNERGFITSQLRVTRLSRFSIVDLMARPAKSPLYKVVELLLDDQGLIDIPFLLVFGSPVITGRLVATNIRLIDDCSHLKIIHGERKFSVAPFHQFFSRRYGLAIKGETYGSGDSE